MRELKEAFPIIRMIAGITLAVVVVALGAYMILTQLWERIYNQVRVFWPETLVGPLIRQGGAISDPRPDIVTFVVWLTIVVPMIYVFYKIFRKVFRLSESAQQVRDEAVAAQAAEILAATVSHLTPEQRDLVARDPRIQALSQNLALQEGRKSLLMLGADDKDEDEGYNGTTKSG